METKIITQDYLKEVLKPFFDIKLRIVQGSLIYPETSIETGFCIEPNGMGLTLYINKDSSHRIYDEMKDLLFKSMRETGHYPLHMNRLDKEYENDSKYPSSGKNDIWPKFEKHFLDNFKVKIGQIYYGSIETIEIRSNGFKINDTLFKIIK